MNKIQSYITDDLLVEGLFGALSWYIFWIILKEYLSLPAYFEVAIAWTLVWYCRKFGITLYQSYKKRHNIKSRNFYLINL
jgi:hypothetical protein